MDNAKVMKMVSKFNKNMLIINSISCVIFSSLRIEPQKGQKSLGDYLKSYLIQASHTSIILQVNPIEDQVF